MMTPLIWIELSVPSIQEGKEKRADVHPSEEEDFAFQKKEERE